MLRVFPSSHCSPPTGDRRRRRGRARFIAWCLGGILGALIGTSLNGCSYGLRNYRYDNAMVREQQGQLLEIHLPDRAIRERMMSSVAPRVGFLACGDPSKGFDPVAETYGNGRAAAITKDGYYLTANHVVNEDEVFLVETVFRWKPGQGPPTEVITQEALEDWVTIKIYPGRIVWSRPDLDLAIVKFPRKSRQYFDDWTWDLEEGQLLYSADDSGRGTFDPEVGMDSYVGNGSFEAAGRVTSVRSALFSSEGKVIRSDLLARGGMSGAPIVTEDGELCGIIVRLEGNPTQFQTVANMISPEKIREIVEKDRNRGEE